MQVVEQCIPIRSLHSPRQQKEAASVVVSRVAHVNFTLKVQQTRAVKQKINSVSSGSPIKDAGTTLEPRKPGSYKAR